MRTNVQLQELTGDERVAVAKLARSRAAETRLVERPQIILAAADGDRPSHMAERCDVTRAMVYSQIKRFNAAGIGGWPALPRSGRPATYPADAVATGIAPALTKPQELQVAFGRWTLDRRDTSVNQPQGIRIKRARLGDSLIAAGLHGRTEATWLGQKVDPDVAANRGASKRAPRHHQRHVS